MSLSINQLSFPDNSDHSYGSRKFRYLLYLPVGLAISAVLLGPLMGSGYWLYEDAVSTPRSFITADTLGIGDLAPRAVPQDWLIAFIGHWVDGGFVVRIITWLGLALLGYSAAILVVLVLRVTPVIAVLTQVFMMANPLIVERIRQGQWSFVSGIGFASCLFSYLLFHRSDSNTHSSRELGASGYRSYQRHQRYEKIRFWSLVGLMSALSSLTISSALIMSIFMIVAIVIRGITRQTFPYFYCGALAIVWIISNIPWLSAGMLNSSVARVSADTIAMYRIRPDSVFGLVGTTLSLAGIWNRFAVTPLRNDIYFSVFQTVVITSSFVVGIFVLYRKTRIWLSRDQSRRQHYNSIVILTIIVTSVVVVFAVIFSGTIWGSHCIYYAVQSIPGAGVLRDSQKFLAIVLPGYALAIASTCQWIKNIATYQFIVLLGLFIVCFSDGFIANWKTLRSIHYPPDFQIAREMVSMHSGDVVSLPAGIMRTYDFTYGVASIDPLPRMLPANVRTSGMVYIDGHPIDSSPSSGSIIEEKVLSARRVADVEKLPISWIIVTHCPGYWGNFPHLADQLTPAYQGNTLTIYQITHTHQEISHHLSTLQLSSSTQTYRWWVMILAHFLWFTMIILGMLVALYSLSKQVIATIRTRNKVIGYEMF